MKKKKKHRAMSISLYTSCWKPKPATNGGKHRFSPVKLRVGDELCIPLLVVCFYCCRIRSNILCGVLVSQTIGNQCCSFFLHLKTRLALRSPTPFLCFRRQMPTNNRDVSLENLLLDEGNTVKLVDFGLALRIPQKPDGGARVLLPQGPCGKPFYMAPEVLSSSVSSGFDGFAVDVWACGVLLFV